MRNPVLGSPGLDSLRSPALRVRGGPQGPPQIARQLEAAGQVISAEAYRRRSALLLFDGSPAGLLAAERALREFLPLDAVHSLRCPVRFGSAPLEGEAADVATGWFETVVLPEVFHREPSVLAILDAGSSDVATGAFAAQPFVAWLRARLRWARILCPVVAVRSVASDDGPRVAPLPGSAAAGRRGTRTTRRGESPSEVPRWKTPMRSSKREEAVR